MRTFFTFVLLLPLALATPPGQAEKLSPEQQSFVQMMVDKHAFSAQEITEVLDQANKNQDILSAIAKPWEAKPWHQYHPIFLTDKRVNKGAEFWQKHKGTLERAEKELGVPAQIIVAIIGVETFFGTYKGKYPVLDALYTLGFYYPPRSKFFRSELEQLFLLAREEKFKPSELMGSYAGAMGWGQFISSSYRHYAIDFDGDGVRDLLNNPVDAIGSVANYFRKHGWQTGAPVAYPATVSGQAYKSFVRKQLKYSDTWADLQAAGIRIESKQPIAVDEQVKLLAFEQDEGEEYWLGMKNFYVITRYNHSPLYAMAVFQLSEQIKQKYLLLEDTQH